VVGARINGALYSDGVACSDDERIRACDLQDGPGFNGQVSNRQNCDGVRCSAACVFYPSITALLGFELGDATGGHALAVQLTRARVERVHWAFKNRSIEGEEEAI
jgi:hypothetical protein